MQNHKLTISYDGIPYQGWQRQGNKPTVQLAIEHALKTCWQQPIILHGSGRTDTGVHALGQVAHFTAPQKFKDPTHLGTALNAHLPPTIRIHSTKFVPDSFHARFSAKGKEYAYRILNTATNDPFELNRALFIPFPLDIDKMKSSSDVYLGTHDFASFASNPGYERHSTIRTITKINITKRKDIITLTFRGNGFLYRMVRNLVGALIKVGNNKISKKDLKEILAAKKRCAAPASAAPHGLYLTKVFY